MNREVLYQTVCMCSWMSQNQSRGFIWEEIAIFKMSWFHNLAHVLVSQKVAYNFKWLQTMTTNEILIWANSHANRVKIVKNSVCTFIIFILTMNYREKTNVNGRSLFFVLPDSTCYNKQNEGKIHWILIFALQDGVDYDMVIRYTVYYIVKIK